MVEPQYIQFEGLTHPVALENADEIAVMLPRILTAWPHHILTTPPTEPPFITIRPAGPDHWEVIHADQPDTVQIWDGVNTVCDIVAEMAWERLRSDPNLLCLHAAAIEFHGRLVVMPNARRAGKSTLAIALARLGKPLYSDDFLPVRVDATTQSCVGIANGIQPRLRLPLPDGFSDAFHADVAQDQGLSNRQYKYLANAPVAPWGEALPLGAMVMLERSDDPQPPQLSPMAREDALASLITQNFARTRHAGAILHSIDLLTRHLPIYRLTYHCAEEAAAYLSAHPDLATLPAAQLTDLARDDRQAPLDQPIYPAIAFVKELCYAQAEGVTESVVGDEAFLADGSGIGIFRLNPVSAAIWDLLEEPTDLGEVVEILSEAFPNVPVDQIAADSENLMRSLTQARLITPVPHTVAAQ
ncbi:PqqD family protein [uncultured Aliiroseovarius sp.]|uniref:PqqD family peptide modification chaperone n=1 Tax=uncultured Aliiroseovarius sp. TaxID=1658783 RepID=UPI00260A9C23|nr:PqqD family protein [uncultured Aliiroseovarius sp.]